MALIDWATHVLQRFIKTKSYATKQLEANLKNNIVFELHAATRMHEDGITSNRGSAGHGEYVPRLCTHRPSHAGYEFLTKLRI